MIPLKAEKQRGKDLNQMDERGLSPALIDPLASGMIQGSFGDTPPPLPLVVRYILKGVQRTLALSLAHLAPS